MQRFYFSLVVLAGAFVIGCGPSTKVTTSADGTVTTVTTPDGKTTTVRSRGDDTQLTIIGADGATVRVSNGDNGIAVPSDFPKDVPVYAGASVTTSATVQNTITLVLKSTDPVSKVAAFYKEQLKASDWTVEAAIESEEGSFLTGKKEDRVLSTSIAKEGTGSLISITIETKK